MPLAQLKEVDLQGKRVLVREDFNVPLKNGEITSDVRIKAALPTLRFLLKKGAKIGVLSHLGRPTEGSFDENLSLQPIAERLGKLLKKKVPLVSDWLGQEWPQDSDIVVFENVRFNKGEKENNEALAEKMGSMCDVFVMDAFATAHRKEASTSGIAKYAPLACAGPLLMNEINALEKITQNPKKPVVAIVGGAKVSTKLHLLESLVKKVDFLLVGGGIANTFVAAEGHPVGKSLHEAELIDEADRLHEIAKEHHAEIPVPIDVVLAEKMSSEAEVSVSLVSQIDDDECIYDIGPDTAKRYASIIKKAGTILWNGPVGVFEIDKFSKGTKAISKAISESSAFKIAGGGDTLSVIEKFGMKDKVNYISTGGGAFLAYLEGKKLPAIEALESCYKDKAAV